MGRKRHVEPEPQYLRKLRYLRRVGLMPDGVSRWEILHDDWCRHWTGKRCNCDVVVRPRWQVPPASRN
jgi:hypothetical protein